jgi:endonuclease/exonuclease/phosphatase family metal-dependent hydrolase
MRRGGGVRSLAPAVAVLVCLAVLPVTLARWAGGEASHPVPLLAAASPFALPALLVAVLLGLAGRLRGVAAVPALLLVPHLVWASPSLAPDGDGTVPAVGVPRMTVLTSNLYLGRADAPALVDAVRRHRVDVLAVQELTPDAARRLRVAGLEELLPHAVLTAEFGASGTGIWTRLPVEAVPVVPGTTFATPRARVTAPGGVPVTVTAAHPFPPLHDVGVRSWRGDLAALRAAVDRTQGAQVVAGDFNATRDHAPFRRLLDGGLRDAADVVGAGAYPGMTWPADRRFPPVMRLDHVLVSREFAVREVAVLEVPGSDHRGVVSVLDIRQNTE